MEDQSRNTLIPAGEMDLTDVLRKLGRFLQHNGRILLITSIVGLAVAALVYKLLPRVFRVRMVVQSSVLAATEEKELLDNWTTLLRPAGYPVLAKLLNTTPERASQLRRFTVEPIGAASDVNMNFTLDVDTGDTTDLPGLQNSILYGLRNNDYVRRRVDVRRQALQEEIDKAQKQLDRLDSASQFMDILRTSAKNNGAGLILDISSIPGQRVKVQESLMEYKEKLAFVDTQIVQGIFSKKKVSPMLPVFGIGGLLGGFLIGYLYCLVLAARSATKRS